MFSVAAERTSVAVGSNYDTKLLKMLSLASDGKLMVLAGRVERVFSVCFLMWKG